MNSGSWLRVGSGARRGAPARTACLAAVVVAMVLAVGLLAGCGSSSPPIEDTLGKFGAAVGTTRQDQMDFEKLKADWATPDYGNGQQAPQALFALYMAGKAADQVLNQPKAEWITYSKGNKDDTTTVTFTITPKEGTIFSGVNLTKITVAFKKTDDKANPWRVQAVTLGA
jgi:hypothetical protein